MSCVDVASNSYATAFPRAKLGRVEELRLLVDALAAFDSKSAPAEAFTTLFQMAAESLEIAEGDLARLLDTTRTTVNRWIRGVNVPSRSMRKPVFDILLKEARKKLKQRDATALLVA